MIDFKVPDELIWRHTKTETSTYWDLVDSKDVIWLYETEAGAIVEPISMSRGEE
jgi:hypothetical protein